MIRTGGCFNRFQCNYWSKSPTASIWARGCFNDFFFFFLSFGMPRTGRPSTYTWASSKQQHVFEPCHLREPCPQTRCRTAPPDTIQHHSTFQNVKSKTWKTNLHYSSANQVICAVMILGGSKNLMLSGNSVAMWGKGTSWCKDIDKSDNSGIQAT